ncbi:N-acetylmuramoyl-L-alanine amidase [Actinotalea sp. BY-33]|uniref:N-acetylmuramoyl-L-alanine amidase n=1 Tax=Actinotalea soli TaxID=2819234 RepID=A0A939LRS5_9CELL|nr:N-acetylmuramoyl-L-alanine amidase [Actinotalea soli]MBO1750949.1 N-acetylmuramoyl-L-alanine amidase [Actinotalea soli]
MSVRLVGSTAALALVATLAVPTTAMGAPPAATDSIVTSPSEVTVEELDLGGVDEASLEEIVEEATAPESALRSLLEDDGAPPSDGAAPTPETEESATASPAPTEDGTEVEGATPEPGESAAPAETSGPTGTTAPETSEAEESIPTEGDGVAGQQEEDQTATSTPDSGEAPPSPEGQENEAAPEPTQTPDPAEEHAEEVDPDVLTAELEVEPFAVMGITWDLTEDLTDVAVRFRVRMEGTWTEWDEVAVDDAVPDADTEDGSAPVTRGASEPVVAFDADGIQVWAEAATGTVQGLKVVLVDPGEDPTGIPSAAQTAVGKPAIITRAQWGAVESQVTCDPDYSRDVRSAVVHHTASTNTYDANQVPGLLRGFMAYHTRPEASGGRGWCDIGYNFLVDKFGRIFEGRTGGVDKPVVGVHVGGFNSRTIGVSAIGNYDTAQAPAALTESISRIIAWKFSIQRISAGTSVSMVSGGGATRFPAGTSVSLPTIFGHRDTQSTACPGRYLYAQLPAIRSRVAAIANATVAASPLGNWENVSATGSGINVSGWALEVGSTATVTLRVSVGGQNHLIAANRNRADVGRAHPASGPLHGFSASVPAGNGRHAVCVTAINQGAGSDTNLGCLWVRVSNATPVGKVDTIRATANGVNVSGWAFDPDTANPINVHIRVGSTLTSIRADRSRPDVGRAHGRGDNHGFNVTLPAAEGSHRVCVNAINVPSGTNPALGACKTVQIGNPPIGHLDAVTVSGSTVSVRGWALDPDTTAPSSVHIQVDGRSVRSVRADSPRADIGRIYGLGDNHGFRGSVEVPDGARRICVFAIDATGGRTNTLLGCRNVVVTNAAPIGHVDAVSGGSGTVTVRGWALDPDTTAPIRVHVYVDGRAVRSVLASDPRADVGRIYGMGNNHGYRTTVAAPPGPRTVCVFAINATPGRNTQTGCRQATVRG